MDSIIERFFVALVLPEFLQDSVNVIKQEFRDRYHSRKAFNSPPHITIQPPFEWEMAHIQEVQDSLQEFATHSFPIPVPIQLRGFGAFPAKVIYINTVKTPELMALQNALVAHLQTTVGLVQPSKYRSFKPHVTVAFQDLTPKAFKQAWPHFEHRPFHADFTASTLTLLHHDGGCWQTFSEFILGDEI